MRPVLVTDILALARALADVPGIDRMDVAQKLIAETDLADLHRQQFAKSHPHWGDGSLSGRCLLAKPAAEPGPDDPAFLEAIAMAAYAVAKRLRWRAR